MKSTPSESISTFRKQFRLHSTIIIILCIAGWVAFIFLRLNGFADKLQRIASTFLAVIAMLQWMTNIEVKELLFGTPEEVLNNLKAFIKKRIGSWKPKKILIIIPFIIVYTLVIWWIEKSFIGLFHSMLALSIALLALVMYRIFIRQKEKSMIEGLINDLEGSLEHANLS